MPEQPLAVLAFSGGLDTSFCVPYLIDKGYRVHTLYVGAGNGEGGTDAQSIHDRAMELGASGHTTHDAGPELWDGFVVPFVMGGAKYQGRYPLLCSDRYAIASKMVRVAEELGADAVAHGCTAMGNDQFRFDQSIRSLCDLPILAPIREIQAVTDNPRAYEIEALESRGFSVDLSAKKYTINENVLGATISGSEIDRWEAPSDASHRMTSPRSGWPEAPGTVTVTIERGVPVGLDGRAVHGISLLAALNDRLGPYGVGRGIYTGDTIVGLKGRIVFEAPGLEGLLTAHKALEELTMTKEQATCKAGVAEAWTRLVFGGLFYDPARDDLEAFLHSSQRNVSGDVTLRTCGGSCEAAEVMPANPLTDARAVYAQHAPWGAADAEGFIRIAGQGSALGATKLNLMSAGAPA